MDLSAPLALEAWHADPLSESEANALFAAGDKGDDALLRKLIARFWLGWYEARDFVVTERLVSSEREYALVALLHGQLLMGRRLPGAHAWLAEGFRRAAHFFEPHGYFAVRNRHRLLAHLSPLPGPVPPEPLDSLLRQARVIEILKAANPASHAQTHDPCDTVG